MGLLGDSFDDPKAQATFQLAAGLLGGGNFGQALGRGLGGYQQTMQSAREAERQKLADDMVKEQLQWKRDDRLQAQAQQQQRQQAMGQLQQAMASGQVTGQDLIKLGVPMDLIKEAMTVKDMGRAEVARTIETEGPNGQKLIQGFDKFGAPVGGGTVGYVAPVQVNLGDRVGFMKPEAGVALPMGQSPESKASNALGWANNALSRQRLLFDMAGGAEAVNGPKPQFNAELGGWTVSPTAKSPSGGFIPLPAGVTGAGPKLTEDQAKASAWLAQGQNAWENMQGAMARTQGKAARPGLGDAVESVPMLGGLGRFLQSADRQQFTQAASSLSEALLRAATGAGVNRDEAAQKINELTPQFGDSEERVQQKMQAIPIYLETLKVRAGKGAQGALSAVSANRPSFDLNVQRQPGTLGSGSFRILSVE